MMPAIGVLTPQSSAANASVIPRNGADRGRSVKTRVAVHAGDETRRSAWGGMSAPDGLGPMSTNRPAARPVPARLQNAVADKACSSSPLGIEVFRPQAPGYRCSRRRLAAKDAGALAFARVHHAAPAVVELVRARAFDDAATGTGCDHLVGGSCGLESIDLGRRAPSQRAEAGGAIAAAAASSRAGPSVSSWAWRPTPKQRAAADRDRQRAAAAIPSCRLIAPIHHDRDLGGHSAWRRRYSVR